jgi:hypothetical protein
MAKKTAAQLKREIAAVLNAPQTPERRFADNATYRRALAAVLQQYGKTFQALADFDRGRH